MGSIPIPGSILNLLFSARPRLQHTVLVWGEKWELDIFLDSHPRFHIAHAVESGSVGLVGARYDLGTGLVEIIT